MKGPRPYILWLPSWYPNKLDPFDGDFIQRHAQAAALHNNILVLRVVGDKKGVVTKTTKKEINKNGNLVEQIIYFKRLSSFIGKIIAGYREMKIYKLAIKSIMRENGRPAVVHVHVPMRAGLVALWIKRKYRIDFILTEHLGIYNDILKERYENRNWTFRFFTKRIFKHASKFISVSKFLGEEINRRVIKKNYSIIPNVVDTGVFNYVPGNNKNFRFIHVSNMVPLKNVEGILDAAVELRRSGENFELILIGNKDDSKSDYAKGRDLTDVSFKGEIPYRQVATEMQRSDALILFSDIENSPCVIAEALCCGLPVIATKVGGIPELLIDKNCLLIKPKYVAGLEIAMRQMLKRSRGYDRKKIAEEARLKFSYETVAKMFNELYGYFF